MERVTLRIPKTQIEEVEQLVEEGEYHNRSAAIRDGVRKLLKDARWERRQRASKPSSWQGR